MKRRRSPVRATRRDPSRVVWKIGDRLDYDWSKPNGFKPAVGRGAWMVARPTSSTRYKLDRIDRSGGGFQEGNLPEGVVVREKDGSPLQSYSRW